MSEADTTDALEVQIQEAQDAGDDAKAQALYQRQQGTEAAASVPAVSDTSGDEAATDPPSLPAPPEGEWTFARPEVVNHQFSLMEADFGELATDLKSEWGADAGQNLEFALATSLQFEAHYPELVATVAARGAGADPLIVELLAQLGRQWAETPGDPTTVRLFPNTGDHGQETNMSEINNDDFDEKTDALMTEETEARAAGNLGKSTRLQREIRALFVRRYGTEPVVGEGGRNA